MSALLVVDLSLLECARENLSARRFAEYLSLARQLATPYRWEELLGAAYPLRHLNPYLVCLGGLSWPELTKRPWAFCSSSRAASNSKRLTCCAKEA